MNVNTIVTLLTALRNDAAHSSLSVAVERDGRKGNAEILGAKLVYPPGGLEPVGIALILDDGDAPEPDAPFWEPSPPAPVVSSVEPVALPESSPSSSVGPRTVAAKRPPTAARKSTRST